MNDVASIMAERLLPTLTMMGIVATIGSKVRQVICSGSTFEFASHFNFSRPTDKHFYTSYLLSEMSLYLRLQNENNGQRWGEILSPGLYGSFDFDGGNLRNA